MMHVNLMRSAIRLLIVTCFMLFVAWLSLQWMRYNGDWELIIYDVQQKFAPVTVAVEGFFNDHVIPAFDALVRWVQSVATPR